MPYVRGVHTDIKIQNIFQICRGKYLKLFRENLDRVPPCPSTWHKNETRRQKFLKWDPFSAQLLLSEFLVSNDILVELVFFYIQLGSFSNEKLKNIQTVLQIDRFLSIEMFPTFIIG